MSLANALLPEFDYEMANTRKALERVPDDKFGWKPHARSHNMGWMANHLANLPLWAAVTLTSDSLDMNPPPGVERPKLPEGKTREQVLANFDKHVKQAREAIANAADQTMMAPWALLNGGKPIFSMPRVAVLRGFVMNHLIHHRGQLTVYFRLNDIPVPALYGPSADEEKF